MDLILFADIPLLFVIALNENKEILACTRTYVSVVEGKFFILKSWKMVALVVENLPTWWLGKSRCWKQINVPILFTKWNSLDFRLSKLEPYQIWIPLLLVFPFFHHQGGAEFCFYLTPSLCSGLLGYMHSSVIRNDHISFNLAFWVLLVSFMDFSFLFLVYREINLHVFL